MISPLETGPVTPFMPPNVIFHVGAAKAGSTAVQNALEEQYDNLLAQGVLFPLKILRRNNASDPTRTPGHLDLLTSPALLLEELEQHAGRVHTLILSIENLFHHPNEDQLTQLADLLKGTRLHLLAVLRDQITWMDAFYYETVVGGIRNETKPPTHLVETMIAQGVLTYEARVQYLTDLLVADTVTVLPYLDACSDLNLLERFAQAARIDIPNAHKLGQSRVNTSKRFAECVEAHRRLNHLVALLPRGDSQQFSHIMTAHYAALNAAQALTPETSCLPPKLKRHIALTCLYDNQRLKKRMRQCQDLNLDAVAAQPTAERKEEVIAHIFDHGIEILAAYGTALPDADQLRLFTPIIDDSDVIMVFGWDSPLVMAAAKSGKFVISIQPDLGARLRQQMHIDQSYLPGAVVVVDARFDGSTLQSVWNKPWFRDPDLIFLAGDSGDWLFQLSHILRKPSHVVIRGSDVPLPDAPKSAAFAARKVTRTGRFSMLEMVPT